MIKLWQNIRMILGGVIPGAESADPLSLSFPIDLEIKFLRYYFTTTLRRTRPAIIVGIILYSLFYLLDIILLPDIAYSLFLIRFGFVVPIGLIVYALSFRPLFRRYYQLFSMLYLLAAGWGIVIMTLIRPHYTEAYSTGIIMVLIYGYILSGLRFYWGSATGWIIVLSYIGGIEWVTVGERAHYLDNYFFLVGSNLLLMFGGYFTEIFYRKDFFLQHQLNQERKKVEATNIGLEVRVADRTKELQAEIVERKGAQVEAQSALRQKEILLKEVYHRTKNNMNVVISLLNMQSEEQKKRPVEGVFRQISDRIYSMSLVHEQLYRSNDLSTIQFDEYVQKLVSRLHYSIPQSPEKIRVSFECEAVGIGLDQAVPLGLAVNEIVTNAFKHSFPDGHGGHLQICMRKNEAGNLEIKIRNDGLPFPEGVSIDHPETLGLHLIKMLIQDQLQSKLLVNPEGEMSYLIEVLPAEG